MELKKTRNKYKRYTTYQILNFKRKVLYCVNWGRIGGFRFENCKMTNFEKKSYLEIS